MLNTTSSAHENNEVTVTAATQGRHPVIFMSGYTADILNDHKLNGCNLLLKPIQPAAMFAKIRQIIDRKKSEIS